MKIDLELNEKSIDEAIKKLNKYKNELDKKLEVVRNELADEIVLNARTGFNNSEVSVNVKNETTKMADVQVIKENAGKSTIVKAIGEDAIFVEFGAGVYFNGSVGSSPHPLGNEMGYTIGSYGKGMGKNKSWGYYDENDELQITYGTPATMPLYHSSQDTFDSVEKIVRKVFKEND